MIASRLLNKPSKWIDCDGCPHPVIGAMMMIPSPKLGALALLRNLAARGLP
jgi:hypothetical protein